MDTNALIVYLIGKQIILEFCSLHVPSPWFHKFNASFKKSLTLKGHFKSGLGQTTLVFYTFSIH